MPSPTQKPPRRKPRKAPRKFPAPILFGAAVALILATIVFALASRRSVDESIALVRRTHQIIDTTHELRGLVVDAETGQRGFLITGDETYLAPYVDALKALREKRGKLRELAMPDEHLYAKIVAASPRLDAKLAELESTIDARRGAGGLEAARRIILNNVGREDMEAFRAFIGELLSEQNALLAKRSGEARRRLNQFTIAVFAGGAASVLTGFVALVFFIRVRSAETQRARLAKEKAAAERSDREKSAFLANMSHEIRTPMNAILGFSELLEDLVDTPLEEKYVRAIRSSVGMLLHLINDILDLSKIEAGRLQLNPETVSLDELAEDLSLLFHHEADEAGIEFSVTTSPDGARALVLDRLRLRQILINLIGNALKFTRKGHVTVHFAATADGDRPGTATLCAEVEDSGIGIDEADLKRIFKPFIQGEARDDMLHQGTGLGLSIARRLAALMGGKVVASSTVGKGSNFRVEIPGLPVAEPEPAAVRKPRSSTINFNTLRPSRLLVVDDNPINRELLGGYFRHSHHEILEARDGEEAIRIASTESPDLILMDIRMPRVNGRQAREAIKSNPKTAHIPIIAITASSMLRQEEVLRTEFDGFARKPVARQELYATLVAFLRPAGDDEPAPLPPPETDGDLPPADDGLLTVGSALAPVVLEEATELRRTMAIGEVVDFARHLESKSDAPGNTGVLRAARELRHAAESFDTSQIDRILARFIEATGGAAPATEPTAP